MDKINWGIIGCGDVTERKSGPAFNKVLNSRLVAVMRRDAEKAEDYAKRHGVPKWYTSAEDLIADPEVNAIYIATPPDSHEAYALAAMRAGKPVYVEKPMTLNESAALNMAKVSADLNVKLTVAHYRRGLALFGKIKELLQEGVLGDIRLINMKMLQPHKAPMITQTKDNWRLKPEISGGGLFHDLAPHQLDLLLWFFGDVKKAHGISANQAGLYPADDIVSGSMLFESGVMFNGIWCFNVAKEEYTDLCEIIGTAGKLQFAVFGNYYKLIRGAQEENVEFELPENIQQPMIEQVVKYFLGQGPNPCTAADGVKIMKLLDSFTAS